MNDENKINLALAEEILYGTAENVASLLQAGADINDIDPYGFTPLVEAAITNRLEIAELLLDKGAQVNEPDLIGRTALHWAADNRNVPLTQLLLDHKADPNAYSTAGQSILVTPLLRGYDEIKKVLYNYDADLNFAQDFINTKLLGHRFELTGKTDIINSHQQFIEIDFEGFYLEFTLNIIYDSLKRYKNNFAARNMRSLFNDVQKIINALAIGAELIKYQQYTINIKEHAEKIDALINNDVIIIPVVYKGHAITFIKCGDLLAKCDRGEYGRDCGTANVYQMQKPKLFTSDLVKNLIYTRQTKEYVHGTLNEILGLSLLVQLPLKPQKSGNCSWANVEGCVPTTLFLLLISRYSELNQQLVLENVKAALDFYQAWREWDKDRALYDCIQSFYTGTPQRKASKVAILAAILFQRCRYQVPKDMERAEKILAVLTVRRYNYILKSYYDTFCQGKITPAGKNLKQILEYFDINF